MVPTVSRALSTNHVHLGCTPGGEGLETEGQTLFGSGLLCLQLTLVYSR